MSIYKLYGAGTGGTESGVASLDIQFDGVITAIHTAHSADLDADTEFSLAEASFLSTATMTTNDARGSLITSELRAVGTVAGAIAANSGVGPVEIPVSAGERVFLHFNSSASTTSSCHVYLYVSDGADVNQRRRR